MPILIDRFTSRLSQATASMAGAAGSRHVVRPDEMTRREFAEVMEAYYDNNNLYDPLMQAMRFDSTWHEALKPLRNPTFAVVEFYVLTLWPGSLPGALPIVAANKKIVEPIHRLWKWSNWDAKKQLAARQYPKLGEMFLRVSTNDTKPATKVRIQVINGKYVTDFDLDPEGHVIWLRYDVVNHVRDDEGKEITQTHTEIWDPEKVRIWQHDHPPGATIGEMGDPETLNLLEIGIDFVPWVYAPFRDDGTEAGMPAVWTQLSKIDETNRKATRIAQILFRYDKPMWAAMANAVDERGRSLPAPLVEVEGATVGDSGTLDAKDDSIIRLPGMSTLTPLVPALNYDAYLKALEADLAELERDLPELGYYKIMMAAGESGRALQLKLTPATTLVNEARGGAETALARANMMALTIGAFLKIKGFEGLGTFDDGDLDHTFAERDVIPLTEQDRADTAKAWIETGMDRDSAYKRAGLTDAEIKALPDPVGPEGTPEEQDAAFSAAIDKATADIGPAFEAATQGVADRALDVLLTTGGIERIAAAKAEAEGGNGAGQGG